MHYEFTTASGKFYARVENCNPMYDRISIGARRKCLVLTVYKDAGEHPQLDGYTQNEKCNLTRGTPQLLKAGIAFMHHLYPNTRNQPIQFKDTSTIQCNHNYKLSLAHYYLVYHGKTWYEAKMGAVPLENRNRQSKSCKQHSKRPCRP